MTTVDATAGESGRPAVAEEAPAAAVVGPLAGDPSIFGLGSFIAGSVALGLGLVGVVPFGVLGAPLAIILAATALGLLVSAIWCAALGQSAVAAVFGIFGTFWLSYAVLVLGLDHNWFAIPALAAVATVRLFLLTWLIIIVMLTLPRCACRRRSPRYSRSSTWPCSCSCSPGSRPRRSAYPPRACSRPAATWCWSSPRSASTCSSARPRRVPAASHCRSALR